MTARDIKYACVKPKNHKGIHRSLSVAWTDSGKFCGEALCRGTCFE